MSEKEDTPAGTVAKTENIPQPAPSEKERSPDDVFYFVACVGFF